MNRKERCLNQERWQSEEKIELCPETNSEDPVSNDSLKGLKKGENLSESSRQESGF